MVGASGCGYLKNTRDDFMDCFILGVGGVVPVVPVDGETRAVGFLPPSIGAYLEVTEFFHLGALFKVSGDLEWDRRALGAVVDKRIKVGLGPLHYVSVQQWPSRSFSNAYKIEGNQMDGWREHMRNLTDPVFGRPAKELVFNKPGGLSFLQRGWQDWEVVSLEIAIPEPFILHSGFNARVGFDLSQAFDFLLGLATIDFYDDNAYTFSGKLQYPSTGGGEK
jgi:hypothetical protein